MRDDVCVFVQALFWENAGKASGRTSLRNLLPLFCGLTIVTVFRETFRLLFEQTTSESIVIFPCEKAVWYNLPQIRADIASGLVKTGMTQSQAAKKLGVTPAAVSQYLNKKRGRQDVKSKAYLEEIGIAVEKVRDGATAEELQSIVCKCCQIITAETTSEDSQCKDNETE